MTCKLLWLSTCAAGLCAPGPAVAQVDLRLVPRSCPEVGEDIRIDIVVGETVAELVGAQFFLAYAPEELEYVDFETVSPFGRIIGDAVIISEVGWIQLAVGLDHKSVEAVFGPAVLGTFVFRPLIAGCEPLRVDWVDQPDLPNQLSTARGLAIQPIAEALSMTVNNTGTIAAVCPANTTLTSAGAALEIEWDPVVLDGVCPEASVITSCGAVDATGMEVDVDAIGGAFEPGTWTIECVSTLSCGASWSCAFELTIEAEAEDDGAEPPDEDETISIEDAIPPRADLEVELDVSSAVLEPGELLILTTTAVHVGGAPTADVALEIEFGPFLEIVSRSGAPLIDGSSAKWRLPALALGERSKRSMVCRLSDLGASGTVDQIQITAYVDHSGDDPSRINNDMRAVIDVAGIEGSAGEPQTVPPLPGDVSGPSSTLCGACGAAGSSGLMGMLCGMAFMRRGVQRRRK